MNSLPYMKSDKLCRNILFNVLKQYNRHNIVNIVVGWLVKCTTLILL